MAKNIFLLIIGILQIVAGVIILGLTAKAYADISDSLILINAEEEKADAFGPVLASILIVSSGAIALAAALCSGPKLDILYIISATVAACTSGAILWQKSIFFSKHCNQDIRPACPEDTYNITVTLWVFAALGFVMSLIGMIVTALRTCGKL